MITSKRIRRGLALGLLLNYVTGIMLPSTAYALTFGANQVEFTSYESAGTTDMVNLSTGDMTYNIPIMEVPSPEGGVTIPMFYHAGIGVEDEASWVGLGWNINMGAISRSVVNYPDDYKDVYVNTNTASGILAEGWVKNYEVYQKTWDSDKGYGGAINLLDIVGLSFDNNMGVTSETILGLSYDNINNHANFSYEGFAMGLYSAVSMYVSAGAGIALSSSGKAASMTSQLATSAATDVATSFASSFIGYNKSFSSQSSYLQAHYLTEKHKGTRKTSWKAWIDYNVKEYAYGSLYLGKMCSNTRFSGIGRSGCERPNKQTSKFPNEIPNSSTKDDNPKILGTDNNVSTAEYSKSFTQYAADANGYYTLASDAHMYHEDGWDMASVFTPSSLSNDFYSVSGDGVSGTITPQRLEIGSICYPKRLSVVSTRYNPVPFLDESTVKPQFRYQNSLSNSYSYHNSDASIPGNTSSGIIASTLADPYGGQEKIFYTIKEEKLREGSSVRLDPTAGKLSNNRLPQGKHIEWFTNQQINNNGTQNFMKYPGLVRNTSTTDYIQKYPADGIGGFSVTKEDGTTYHYALPVYTYGYKSVMKEGSNTNTVTVNNLDKYATSWLLTGITGPDFVDRGTLGEIDDQDYGYWVKFDYGKFSKKYGWRTPYIGEQADIRNPNIKSFEIGSKETYYLNSVTTRSHIALFIKDIRKDSRSYYLKNAAGTAVEDDYSTVSPSSSLALKEIALMSREDYTTYLSSLSTVNAGTENSTLALGSSYESFDNVIDNYDVNRTATIRNNINQYAVSRVVFNQDYSLCPETVNSFESPTSAPNIDATDMYTDKTGKLTLKSVSMYGRNNVKAMPDYVFDYYNPSQKYRMNEWDAWGLCEPTNSVNTQNSTHYHISTDANKDLSKSWSLKSVLSPIGTTTTFDYEKDSYSSIAGKTQLYKPDIVSAEKGSDLNKVRLYLNPIKLGIYKGQLSTIFPVNSQFKIENLQLRTKTEHGDGLSNWKRDYYDLLNSTSSYTVSEIDNATNSIVITPSRAILGQISGLNWRSEERLDLVKGEITIPASTYKLGGDLRVSAISISDGSVTQKSRYIYTQDGQPNSLTSGVISKEPYYACTAEFDFFKYYDWPSTPVLYSKVTVLNGPLSTDNDYVSKTEYNFITPNGNMIKESYNMISNFEMGNIGSDIILTNTSINLEINTSGIGNISEIKYYDPKNMIGKTNYKYSNNLPNQQGKFSEGTINCVYVSNVANAGVTKFIRTQKNYQPCALVSISQSKYNKTTEVVNKTFDPLTGQVLETEFKNYLGNTFLSKSIPAYTKYSGMGSKAVNSAYKNMLIQQTGEYLYKWNTTTNAYVPMAASVTTWNNAWKYRSYNSTTDMYEDLLATDAWRKQSTFVWNSADVNADGTFNNFTDYVWGGSNSAKWQKQSEFTKFDRYSHPLEVKDINGNYSTLKFGFGDKYPLATVNKAKYNEMAYANAEETVGANQYCNEVKIGTTSTDYAHTGNKSVQIPAASTAQAFTYKAPAGTTGLELNKDYLCEVWVYDNGNTNTAWKCVATKSDGTTVSISPVSGFSTSQAYGKWIRKQVKLKITDATIVKVECSWINNDASKPAYFDDFRLYPYEEALSSALINPSRGTTEYTFDNNGLYTRYVYDDAGKLAAIYKETVNGEVLVSKFKTQYSRQ